jgi:hypothetical protein
MKLCEHSNVSVHLQVHEDSNEASGSVKVRELLTFTLAVSLLGNILNGIMKYCINILGGKC